MTKSVVSRFLYFVLFLQGVERDTFLSLVKASLEDTWKIDGPRAKIKISPVNNDNNAAEKNSDSKLLPCDTCRSPQAFQLEYSISNKVKLARYKVFQLDCNNEFEVGTELVQGTGDIIEKEGSGPFYTMDISSNPLDDSQIASVELVPTIAASTNETSARSYLMDLYSVISAYLFGDDVAHTTTVRFCIRMGLFLPPEAGGMEVNFRETNVIVTLREDLSVQHVELEARPMNPVTVHIAGAKLKSDTPIQKMDHTVNDSPEEPRKDEPNETDLPEQVSDNSQETDEL
jgi:hypothetical protein